MSRRVELFDCPFDAVGFDEAVDLMFGWMKGPARTTHHVVTVNVAILMMARDNPDLARAIERADLVVVDGKPLVWSSRWLGAPLPERVSGVDLMRALLERGDARGLSVYLLGTTQERLDVLRRVLSQRYPNVRIAGARNGYFSRADDAAVVQDIARAQADLLLVGMPAPFKEVWCEAQRQALDVPVVLGVGGAFDVLAGFVARAPRVLQEAGLEWAWRLTMEPRKLWRRYLVTNTAFLALLGKTLARRHRRSQP